MTQNGKDHLGYAQAIYLKGGSGPKALHEAKKERAQNIPLVTNDKAGYESRIVDSPRPHEATKGKQMGQAPGELLILFLGL